MSDARGAGNTGGIFISYRRGDTGGHAGRLYDDLVDHFGRNKVFRDIDALQSQLGLDFTEALDRALEASDVVLVLIGPNWLGIGGSDGTRRLDNPEDILHQEISRALARPMTRVIPVLLGGAAMPPSADLPAPLKPLARRQAIDISDRRWSFDVAQLIAAIEPLVGSQTPATPGASGSNRGAIATVIAVLLVAAGVGGLFAFDILPPGNDTTPTPEPSPTELARGNGGTEEAETPSPTDEPQPTDTPPQPSPSPTHTPEQPTPSPTNTPDPTPTETPEPETPTPTETPTAEPTPTEEPTPPDFSAPTGWSVTGLEHPTSDGAFEAYAINGDGVIAGSSDTDGGNSHAVIWDENGVRSLGALPGDPVSVAFDINESGQLAGWSETNDGIAHAVWWDERGEIIGLDDLPDAIGSSAFGINDNGLIVGSSTGLDGGVYATSWDDGTPSLLPALPGDLQSTALDVNNAGQIIGWSGSPDAVQRAVLWQDGEVTALGELPGHTVSTAFGINADGQIVGVSSSASEAMPVIWDDGQLSVIDLPSGYAWAIAFGISDNGVIAGTAGQRDGDSFAMVWADGQATGLDALPNHEASGAYAVNGTGQVVGWSSLDGVSHAVTWEPQLSGEALDPRRSASNGPGDQRYGRDPVDGRSVRFGARQVLWSHGWLAPAPAEVAGLRGNRQTSWPPR